MTESGVLQPVAVDFGCTLAGIMPKGFGGSAVLGRPAWAVVAFEEKVVQEKAGIEARVAVVDDFEVDQHHATVRDEAVLRRPIAVDQRVGIASAGLDAVFKGGSEVCMVGSGEAVVGIEAELVEAALVAEGLHPRAIFVAAPGGFELLSEEAAGGGGVGFVDCAREEERFPVGCIAGSSFHGVDEVFGVVKDDRGHGAARKDSGETAKSVAFAMDAGAIGQPFFGDTELAEGLFEDPAVRGAFAKENRVGDAATEGFNTPWALMAE